MAKQIGEPYLFTIRINDQWRFCFVWKQPHAYNVEINDYH